MQSNTKALLHQLLPPSPAAGRLTPGIDALLPGTRSRQNYGRAACRCTRRPQPPATLELPWSRLSVGVVPELL
eukprot:364781-Chlamydomonas_euryale.AAC.9